MQSLSGTDKEEVELIFREQGELVERFRLMMIEDSLPALNAHVMWVRDNAHRIALRWATFRRLNVEFAMRDIPPLRFRRKVNQ